ncbi:hypothetical protein F4804DRAFT_348335 [Jackrogersella minutella]|nr:hypothetical protein F4804DRAFT_348335 [Jackrogersella minutella]
MYTPATFLDYSRMDQNAATISKYDAIIESPDDSQGALTFGIELEFLMPLLAFRAADPHPLEKRPVFLRGNYYDMCQQTVDILETFSGVAFRTEIQDSYYNNIINYDKWRLTDDRSVGFQKLSPKQYYWIGREITSEVMESDNPALYIKKITDVCRAIRQLRVNINDTTAVHVHVGLGDEPFSLLTMKKSAALILLVDEMLIGLHHPHRRDNLYCALLSMSSKISMMELDADHPLNETQAQEMAEFIPLAPMSKQTLQATNGIEELARLMVDPAGIGVYRGSIGFTRFLPVVNEEEGGNTQTFEFRQMAGCLDPKPIIHWARVCMAIIDFARLSEANRFKGLLERIMKEESFSAFDLLSELKLVEEEKFFRSSVEGYEKSLAYYAGDREGLLFVPQLE